MLDFFLKHPRSLGETWFEHFSTALAFGAHMIAGGLACIIHAVIPPLFERTASRTVVALHTRMITHRRGKPSTELDYAI
jgi:hypothetical protein